MQDSQFIALMFGCLLSGLFALQAAMRSGYVYDNSRHGEAPLTFLLAFFLGVASVGCAFKLGMEAEAIAALRAIEEGEG